MSKKQSASRSLKPNNEVINTYIDERGIKITVYKSQHPRLEELDRKSTRLNSSHIPLSRMPSSA